MSAVAVPTRIDADFAKILSNYPAHTQLPADLRLFLQALNGGSTTGKNTPCCMQVCHAFNLSGLPVPSGNFRPGDPKRVAAEIPLHSGRYYLLAVDEMVNYLSRRFGEPLVLDQRISSRLSRAKSATVGDVRALTEPIRGLEGVITFGNAHIELWNRGNIVQDTGAAAMDFNWVWSRDPVRFWRIGTDGGERLGPIEAMMLDGWWDVFDGNQYHYFIDGKKSKVWYTKTRPAGPRAAVPRGAPNSGDLTVEPIFKLVMDWDPAGGGATRETFTFNFADPVRLVGTSNRYAQLRATKMFVAA